MAIRLRALQSLQNAAMCILCALLFEYAVMETLRRKMYMHDPKGENISRVKFLNFNL